MIDKYETAEKPADKIMADITKPKKKRKSKKSKKKAKSKKSKKKTKSKSLKIIMTKVFRGEINGKYKVYLPGDEVAIKDAEYIKKNHPAWYEKGSDA